MDPIHPRTSIGYVDLTVRSLDETLHFYRDIIGFREALRASDTTVFLSATGAYPFHLGLTSDPEAAPRSPRTAGLYHFAILMPTRADLARMYGRLQASRVALDGASDHLVSEAIYLRDPEGNGIEIYADRDRSRWAKHGDEIVMATEPLDLRGLLAEAAGDAGGRAGMPPQTIIGHVHLRVSDLGRAEAFYHGVLGFAVTVRRYPGALFLSAGGYHHHLGVNVWAGAVAPAPRNSTGLRYFTVRMPELPELRRTVREVQAHKVPIDAAIDHGWYYAVYLKDPDDIGVALTVDRAPDRGRSSRWQAEPISLASLLEGDAVTPGR